MRDLDKLLRDLQDNLETQHELVRGLKTDLEDLAEIVQADLNMTRTERELKALSKQDLEDSIAEDRYQQDERGRDV